MFRIESYVTPILLSYVDKYVRDFKPADAQVSLWAGGVVLHNLVLKPDVLQQEVALPFTLVSGRIHELLIQVPWTKIISEPIVVTIDTIECVLSLHSPAPEESTPSDAPSPRPQVMEAPPGYMQALVRRIVSNISLKVHHLIVKYVQDDIVLSLNVKHLSIESCGPDWIPTFADIDQTQPVIRRAVVLDNLTLCLDQTDSDGKIRYYQEPLLYRCQLNLRVLTRLVSANIRRASSLNIELRSDKLAWGVTSDQMTLLLRLLKECRDIEPEPNSPSMRNTSATLNSSAPQPVSSLTAEPTRSGSWSEWAWSWMPSWYDRAGGTEADRQPPSPTPISFSAYLDDVSLIFKVMEIEAGNRKRPRGFLEIKTVNFAVKGNLCVPTSFNIKVGVRSIVMKSQDKCTCGHVDASLNEEEPTFYIMRDENYEVSREWSWPDDGFDEGKVEKAEVAEEAVQPTTVKESEVTNTTDRQTEDGSERSSIQGKSEPHPLDNLWQKMDPLVYIEYVHERAPPTTNINPYDNPPKDFEYSDWLEECGLDIQVKPVKLRVCMGLIHRIETLKKIWKQSVTISETETITHVLTVEEMEHLSDNLPQRRINIDLIQLQLCFYPWDHSLTERPLKPPALVEVDVPKGNIVINCPLYPHRVCSAVSQIPEDRGLLWRGAKLHISSSFNSLEVKITSSKGEHAKPCARLDMRLVVHILLNQHFFKVFKQEPVLFSYSLKLHEANISGSAPRLETVYQVLWSLLNKTYSNLLRCSTMAKDALRDEELVALDLTFEDVTLRGYRTKNVNTHVFIIHSARGTVHQSTERKVANQAWIFSAPDVPSNTPFVRGAVQWCPEPTSEALEYVGMWTEPIAIAIDPLFVAWFAYKPRSRPPPEPVPSFIPKTISSNVFMMKRRLTPPSSSGRGGSRSGSAAELVHQRTKSVGTSSDKEGKDSKSKETESPKGDKMLALHERLKKTLVTVDMGLVVLYVTTSTASAVDCATLRLAVERHAARADSGGSGGAGGVLVVSLGRWSMHSSGFTRNIWQDIRHDGPTFNIGDLGDCFPWKISLADVSCYTLDFKVGTEKSDKFVGGLRSQLKSTFTMVPKTILDLVTTTLTLSVVSKSVVFKTVTRKPGTKKSASGYDKDEKVVGRRVRYWLNIRILVDRDDTKCRTKFFTGGGSFKPTSLKEFVRGPSSRKKSVDTKSTSDEVDQLEPSAEEEIAQTFSRGPLVSIGLNLHADTPPIIIRLDQEQVHIVSAALHCLKHMISLLRSNSPVAPPRKAGSVSMLGSNRSISKPFVENEEELQRTGSQDSKSELVSIYQARPQDEIFADAIHLKKFIWFQWVVNRASAIISSEDTKLVFEMEDFITTLDIQEHYRQLKMKMASFCVKHFMKDEDGDWKCGVLGGRVLEVSEPTVSKEDQFLSVTITQAQISTLPPSWKEELNPKMLDRKENNDNMFEIYAVLAPMEAVLEASLLEQILTLLHETYSSTNCPMEAEIDLRPEVTWPFCYLSAGGLRLIICAIDKQKNTDDTILLEYNKITLNPHPENPISRRPLTLESSWLPSEGSLEGRQYDILIEDVAIYSTQLTQLISQEKNQMEFLKKGGVENPARKWGQIDEMANLTPILHPINLNCIFAPALFFGETLICGSGWEINLLSDCAIDLSIDHLQLIKRNLEDFGRILKKRETSTASIEYIEQTMCPYADLLNANQPQDESDSGSDYTSSDDQLKAEGTNQSLGGDSGVETVASQSTSKSKESEEPTAIKKNVSVGFLDQISDPRDHVEIFVTMGTIELTLYTSDDDSPEIAVLRLPRKKPDPFEEAETDSNAGQQTELRRASCSLTEMIRRMDIGKTKIILADINLKQPRAFKIPGNIPLVHVTLQQPNLYYWKKKVQKNIQVSLFDAWVGLGDVQTTRGWKRALLSTCRGVPDPATDVPPALATMKITMSSPTSHTSLSAKSRGSLKLDVERPIMFEVCSERIKRVIAIRNLIDTKLSLVPKFLEPADSPALYKLRRLMANFSIEQVVIQTGQVGVSGSEGAAGWDSASLQAAWGVRPDRLNIRALIGALLVGSGSPYETRHQMLQPLQIGMELDAQWETWRRVEGGDSCREPTVRVRFDLDRVIVELQPSDLEALSRIESVAVEFKKRLSKQEMSEHPSSTSTNDSSESPHLYPKNKGNRLSVSSTDSGESSDHFYKDDLRSGAFKVLSGGQLPMAYQVMLSGNTVSWRYPHPRTITRLVAFPLPGQNEEIKCVLELYDRLLNQWEPYAYFSIPVTEPKEYMLYGPAPEALFSTVWRFRVQPSDTTQDKHSYEFRMNRFTPRPDPLGTECQTEMGATVNSSVTAEQLSGVLRVDSYFAPRLLMRLRICVQMTSLELNLHNSLPVLSRHSKTLEGYYISKPLRQSHRVLMFSAREVAGHFSCGPSCGMLMLLSTNLSSYISDSATGTMEKLVEEFLIQSSISIHHQNTANSRLRLRTSTVHVLLNIPRLRTLQSLFSDWNTALIEYMLSPEEYAELTCPLERHGKLDTIHCSIKTLEGRVSLWLNNTCVTALRIGQEESDEVVLLEAGSSLAYRWRNPTAPKRVRFALANPSADWHWSSSVAFTAGSSRVRLENAAMLGSQHDVPGAGVYLHVSVEETGAYRSMNLSGRLVLANMLRFELLYKVRGRFIDPDAWRTISSGELAKETVCRSVLCGANTEMMLKLKLCNHETGWSGDIPLKECPKENVPWLVKVPSEGDMSYISVWCRVVRARSDGRILATIWPLYVLYSHLPLDTDVLIVTETMHSSFEGPAAPEPRPPPLIQPAPGRGYSSQLMAPGTTSAKHSLSFQYRNIECPVTREAVPLHYGVTDTSVFEKRGPVISIDEVLQDVVKWLQRSGRHANSLWPYSIVSNHWPSAWHPAQLQPRCDVTVRYRAVRAGGGCSLEVHLSPIALLCNASPVALTLRAHDAAPLCKLEPGTALSPPSAILHKPFFMSVEMGRETFVSGQLEVTASEPGRYSEPPPGQVALDRSTNFAIQCNQKVALFTLFYEIKEDINVLGITSTFTFVNKMNTDILVSAIATPVEESTVLLHPKTFKVVQPSKDQREIAIPLCRFWLRSRWRGGDAAHLNTFLCLAIPAGAQPASAPAPVRLGRTPARQPIALIDAQNKSVPVVVTQHTHEGRTVITIARDPCPQFLVHNRTNEKIAVAQPVCSDSEPNPSTTQVVADCDGARWRCVVDPRAACHYSTPAYCARHPPCADHIPRVPFLTFAVVGEDSELSEWCQPVAATEGEQLVQLSRGYTIKMCAHIHPHSTLVELQPIDERDISASDIRNRLLGSISSDDIIRPTTITKSSTSTFANLERTGADNKLLPTTNAANLTEERVLDELRIYSETSLAASNFTKPQNTSELSEEDDIMLTEESNKDNESLEVTEEVTIRDQVLPSELTLARPGSSQTCSFVLPCRNDIEVERVKCVMDRLVIEMSVTSETEPLVAVHVDRVAVSCLSQSKHTKTMCSIMGLQVDNLQYESGQFDFAVVATTRGDPLPPDDWPPLYNMFIDDEEFCLKDTLARFLVTVCYDKWSVAHHSYHELTELEMRLGPLALYVEDAYITALIDFFRLAVPEPPSSATLLAEARILQRPLRLRLLHIEPVELTLTLHTAVRIYIALDQSPLNLSSFRVRDLMTSSERLAHALTVHYLSAAILGAGWVVGGLELLGAPGALAARVGGATGGVRGIASAAAAALLRSLSAWAGSLARNLDILAGDEEHARRAAAARRRPPHSFIEGLVTGITNFAINILGAVGGLAHHPLVGVAVGETESGAAALRRGLVGALAKPLSATADLVAYAGQGLLQQTGWDPVPQPRPLRHRGDTPAMSGGWRRDCVRWTFRLAELTVLSGFKVLLNNAHLLLLFTHKFIVVADPESERVVEMIDLRFCTLSPYQGTIIELSVSQRRLTKTTDTKAVDEDDEYHVSAAAMARVARYTGAEEAGTSAGAAAAAAGDTRVLLLLPAPGESHSLHAALAAAIHNNADTHFAFL